MDRWILTCICMISCRIFAWTSRCTGVPVLFCVLDLKSGIRQSGICYHKLFEPRLKVKSLFFAHPSLDGQPKPRSVSANEGPASHDAPSTSTSSCSSLHHFHVLLPLWSARDAHEHRGIHGQRALSSGSPRPLSSTSPSSSGWPRCVWEHRPHRDKRMEPHFRNRYVQTKQTVVH